MYCMIHVFYVTDNLEKCLSEFGVCNGTRLKVDDFLQNMTLVVTINTQVSTCVLCV